MFEGFLFGVTVAAAVGPIALLIVDTSLRYGLSAGVRSGLGAAVADLFYAIGAVAAGAGVVSAISAHEGELRVASSVVLIAVGLWLLRSAFAPAGERRSPQQERPFVTTLALTAVNPLTLIVFASFVMQRQAAADVLSAALVVAGIFLGSLVVQMALALGGAGLSRWLSGTGAIRLLNIASGLGIVAFGVFGLLRP